MPIVTTSQTVTVDEVTGVSVTSIEQDPDTGEYVREVRVSANVGGTPTMTFRLQVRSATREGVEYATPSLNL